MSIRIDGAVLFGASIFFSIVINTLDSNRRLKVNVAKSVFSAVPLLDRNLVVSNHRTKTDERPANEAKPAVNTTNFAVEIEDAVVQVLQPRAGNGKPVGKSMKASSIPEALDISSAAATTLPNEKSVPLSAEEEENSAAATDKEEISACMESKISTVQSVITAPESSFSVSPSEDLDAGIDVDNDAVW